MQRTATHMGMRMFSGQKLSATTGGDASSVAAAVFYHSVHICSAAAFAGGFMQRHYCSRCAFLRCTNIAFLFLWAAAWFN